MGEGGRKIMMSKEGTQPVHLLLTSDIHDEKDLGSGTGMRASRSACKVPIIADCFDQKWNVSTNKLKSHPYQMS
jgi:hypothetical protein